MTSIENSGMPQQEPGATRSELVTLRDVLRVAVTRFGATTLAYGQGQADAWEEALFLLTRSLCLPFERAEAFLDARLAPAEIEMLLARIERRAVEHVPVAYLLREAWLQGYRFYVDERVIVPRSFLGELLHERLAPWIGAPEAVDSVIDLCTGSGCLAIMAADAFPGATVDAVDLSADALAVARRNVDEYDLADRVRLVQSDLFDALSDTRYDLILSNPPYVTAASMARLPAEYRHEPRLALAAGADGMDVVRRLLGAAREHLRDDGLLVVEVGGERATVEALFGHIPMTWLTTSAGDDMVFLVHAADLP